jgi:putative endonuclease
MYYVYVLWSSKLGKRYIGSTGNAEKRLREHNSRHTQYTSRGVPWIKIHEERYGTIHEAREREKYLKSGMGRGWLDKLYPQYRRGARVV